MLLWLLRALFSAIIIGMAIAAFTTFADAQEQRIWPGIRAALVILAVGAVVMLRVSASVSTLPARACLAL